MSKIFMVVLAFASLAYVGIRFGPLNAQENSIDQTSMDKRAEDLDRQLQGLTQFRQEMDGVLTEIIDDDLSLAEAVARVEEAAAKYHRIYLDNLHLAKHGKTLKTQIAYNILQHVDIFAQNASVDLSATRARLQEEFDGMSLVESRNGDL